MVPSWFLRGVGIADTLWCCGDMKGAWNTEAQSALSVGAELWMSSQKWRIPFGRDRSMVLRLPSASGMPLMSNLRQGVVSHICTFSRQGGTRIGMRPRFCKPIDVASPQSYSSWVVQHSEERERKLIGRLFKFFSNPSRSSFLKWSWSSCTV